MKIKSIIRGFTLIELLVVITIIGILATGAVSVYTSQIQKSRDSVRLTDIKALQSGVEQMYQDESVYPARGVAFSGITVYIKPLPQDPKFGQANGKSAFDYFYNESDDINGVLAQEYELSTTFEQSGNLKNKAANTADNGNDADRFEVGIDVDDTSGASTKPTKVTAAITAGAKYQCTLPAGGTASATNCTAATANPMLIRK